MRTGICTNDNSSTLPQCISRRGGLFEERSASSEFVISSQADLLGPEPNWDFFNPQFSSAANTTIQFASDIFLTSYPIALALAGQSSTVSVLGLANDSVFLHQVVKAGLSPVAAFGLLVGSQSVSSPRDGHLVIGGYDAASLAGPFTNYLMSNATTSGNHVCPLQVVVEQLLLIHPGLPDIELSSEGTPITSCIEP
jgi:hypothetical protein